MLVWAGVTAFSQSQSGVGVGGARSSTECRERAANGPRGLRPTRGWHTVIASRAKSTLCKTQPPAVYKDPLIFLRGPPPHPLAPVPFPCPEDHVLFLCGLVFCLSSFIL